MNEWRIGIFMCRGLRCSCYIMHELIDVLYKTSERKLLSSSCWNILRNTVSSVLLAPVLWVSSQHWNRNFKVKNLNSLSLSLSPLSVYIYIERERGKYKVYKLHQRYILWRFIFFGFVLFFCFCFFGFFNNGVCQVLKITTAKRK